VKTPPNSTRNISGKSTAKNIDILSRRNPFTIASAIARKAFMARTAACGIPDAARAQRVAWCSCAVLAAGEVQEHVLEGGALDLQTLEHLELGEPGQHN
jgi:hypothetical protein